MSTQWLAYNDLVHYDEKIKAYIARRDELLKKEVYSKEDIDNKLAIIEELKEELRDLEVLVRSHESSLKDLKDHIDENEAAIASLQDDDKEIIQQIADIRADAETKYGKLNTKFTNEIGKINTELNNKVDESVLTSLATKADLDNLATTEYVKDAIRDAQLGEADIDLSDYAKKSQVDELSNTVGMLHDEIDNVQRDLDKYITETELAALNYATKDGLTAAIKEVENKIPSLDNYVTKDSLNRVQEQIGIIDVKFQMIDSDLVDINNKLDKIPVKASDLINDSGYITENDLPDITQYVTKSELDSMNFVSEDKISSEYVSNEIYSDFVTSINKKVDDIQIPEVPTKISELENDLKFATEQYVLDHMNTQIETEVETQVTEVVEKQVTEVVQTQVKDEVAVAIANNSTIQYGEF